MLNRILLDRNHTSKLLFSLEQPLKCSSSPKQQHYPPRMFATDIWYFDGRSLLDLRDKSPKFLAVAAPRRRHRSVRPPPPTEFPRTRTPSHVELLPRHHRCPRSAWRMFPKPTTTNSRCYLISSQKANVFLLINAQKMHNSESSRGVVTYSI